jgi:hypothetical protein
MSMDLPAPCPILANAQHVLDLSQGLTYAYHRLRSSLRKCRNCPQQAQCTAIQEYNRQVTAAIEQVVLEFNIQ